jgi:hypothetical protein
MNGQKLAHGARPVSPAMMAGRAVAADWLMRFEWCTRRVAGGQRRPAQIAFLALERAWLTRKVS